MPQSRSEFILAFEAARSPLLVDLYELAMGQAYLREGLAHTGDVPPLYRKLPRRWGYLVAAGLADVLTLLENSASARKTSRSSRRRDSSRASSSTGWSGCGFEARCGPPGGHAGLPPGAAARDYWADPGGADRRDARPEPDSLPDPRGLEGVALR